MGLFGKEKTEGLGFGAKTIEELEARDDAKTPPPKVEEEVKTEPTLVENKIEEPAKVETRIETKPESPKINWLDEVSKISGSEFKTPEEFKSVFEKTKKVPEYETKLKGYEESERKYLEQISALNGSLKEQQNPLSYFSSQESFVAEQLRKQHPDKSPYVLQEIVTSDNKRMTDLDILVKNQMLETPDLIGGEQGAKEYVLDKYGIDPSIPKEEWSITLQNKIKIEANQARKEWDKLKSEVVLPKVTTPQEKEAERVRLVEEKKQKITPFKETFSKFDKFTEQIEDGKIFEMNVSDEYKAELPEMFEQYFMNGGIDVNKESLENLEELKRAMFLSQNFKQIYKVIEGDVETRMKAERDLLLNNTNPANTQSAAELEIDDHKKFSKEHGLGKLMGKK